MRRRRFMGGVLVMEGEMEDEEDEVVVGCEKGWAVGL